MASRGQSWPPRIKPQILAGQTPGVAHDDMEASGVRKPVGSRRWQPAEVVTGYRAGRGRERRRRKLQENVGRGSLWLGGVGQGIFLGRRDRATAHAHHQRPKRDDHGSPHRIHPPLRSILLEEAPACQVFACFFPPISEAREAFYGYALSLAQHD